VRALQPESRDERLQRLKTQKASKEFRSEKRYRRRGGAKEDVELANIFLGLGLDYLNLPKEEALRCLPQRLEGRRVDSVPEKSLTFLKESYDVQQVIDDEGRLLLHFKKRKKGEPMSIIADLAESTGVQKKTVKQVYQALVEYIQPQLKEERKVRIPDIGQFRVKYRGAKPKRKGRNPFSGKEMWFKAKPASNKLRFSPSKGLKDYVKEEIDVVEPKKKHKKSKK